MHLNTIAGRTYNDLSQYPVVSVSVSISLPHFWTKNWSHIATYLMLVVLLVLVLVGTTSSKKLRLCHFKSDRGEIWQDCVSSKYASIDIVGFLIWCHCFKMATLTSFISRTKALPSAWHMGSSLHQFMIHFCCCYYFCYCCCCCL